ncbi:MAG: TetR/AcrR family transcriptional regulator [Paracoccaceae bacterium]
MRSRKKAQRREDILLAASGLFADKGIDATTMAEIADAVGVSPPTIFNYFGNKDGILIALITEGTQTARALHRNMLARTDTDFATILIDLFALFAERTIQIASKRIWRYAEAASIRHPTTDLAREYATVDRELTSVIANIFDRYAIRLRSGDAPDSALLAEIFYDAWNTAFFRLIKSDDLTLDQHRADLRQRFEPLARMIFADDFLETPTLKIGHAAHGPS